MNPNQVAADTRRSPLYQFTSLRTGRVVRTGTSATQPCESPEENRHSLACQPDAHDGIHYSTGTREHIVLAAWLVGDSGCHHTTSQPPEYHVNIHAIRRRRRRRLLLLLLLLLQQLQ